MAFTGSTEIGRQLLRYSAESNLKRVVLELGGKNAQIVMDDADLELALDGVLWGAFGTTGQRCTATSRLILHDKIHDKFMEMLTDRTKKLRLGDGLLPSVDVGPCINEGHRKNVHSYIEIGKNEGASLVCGGKIAAQGDLAKGWFYEPTIFDNVKPNMRIAQEEIFGPVLSVIRTSSLEDAINILNGTIYGLSSSIYTRDVNKAFSAIRDIKAGITYINVPTIGAEAHLPFGGVKRSGYGRELGAYGIREVLYVKTVRVA